VKKKQNKSGIKTDEFVGDYSLVRNGNCDDEPIIGLGFFD